MKRVALLLLPALLGAVVQGSPALAAPKKRIACTLPVIEALVKEVGGDRVEAFSLAAGDQDPHFVSPTPSLMKRVREADLLLEIGMQLEPWADEVANGSGNPRIFRGAAGRIALSTGIPKLEVPATITRAGGDIHPEGNPHLWLDPIRAKMLAQNVARALKTVAPADGEYFEGRLKDFQRRVDSALFGDRLVQLVGGSKLSRLAVDGRLHEFLNGNDFEGKKLAEYAGGWLAKGRSLHNQKVVEFHKVWVYFARVFGFELVATIEERPGIQPGPRHLSQLVEEMKRERVRLVLVDNFYDPSLAASVAQQARARVALVPNQVRGEAGVDSYFALIDHILDKAVGALAQAGPSQG